MCPLEEYVKQVKAFVREQREDEVEVQQEARAPVEDAGKLYKPICRPFIRARTLLTPSVYYYLYVYYFEYVHILIVTYFNEIYMKIFKSIPIF